MCVFDIEVLALIFAVNKWSLYLPGNHFLVRTDKKP